jgi:hypothetical protein
MVVAASMYVKHTGPGVSLQLQEFIDIVETIYRGARKGRGLVVSPKDYSTKYRYVGCTHRTSMTWLCMICRLVKGDHLNFC